MIAIDWGTSALRGALLDRQGGVLQERSAPLGILYVPPGGFEAVFNDLFGDWMRPPSQVALMAGMVGSQQGWQEAPYCPCPAGAQDIAGALRWVQPGRIAIVPGLSCQHAGLADAPELAQVPDVMRGEETQILGALAATGLKDATLVLPGTHSKWARVRAQRIEAFTSYMTGEVYQLLRQHSLLARTLPPLDDATAADDPDHGRVTEVGIELVDAEADEAGDHLRKDAHDQPPSHSGFVCGHVQRGTCCVRRQAGKLATGN
jgi:2-dehydro-3-deoxygalactonokinase